MLRDPAECVEPTGSITTVNTPEMFDAVFTIPSSPKNLPTNGQLTSHRVRAELQGVPTLDVTPQLIREIVAKIKTHYKMNGSKELRFQPSRWNTLSETAGLFAFTL